MNRTQIQLQNNRFKYDPEDVNDDVRLGRPNTSTTDENIETSKTLILDNHRITIREVADEVGISFGLCQAIFTDVLDMKHAAAKIVSKLLNFEQTQRRMDIAQEKSATFNNDPDLLKKVIIFDETWVYG